MVKESACADNMKLSTTENCTSSYKTDAQKW
jgi:hypothetical protein